MDRCVFRAGMHVWYAGLIDGNQDICTADPIDGNQNYHVARRPAVYSTRSRSRVEQLSTNRELYCLHSIIGMLLPQCDSVGSSVSVDTMCHARKPTFRHE